MLISNLNWCKYQQESKVLSWLLNIMYIKQKSWTHPWSWEYHTQILLFRDHTKNAGSLLCFCVYILSFFVVRKSCQLLRSCQTALTYFKYRYLVSLPRSGYWSVRDYIYLYYIIEQNTNKTSFCDATIYPAPFYASFMPNVSLTL